MITLNYKDTACTDDEDGVGKWHNWNSYFLSLGSERQTTIMIFLHFMIWEALSST